MKRIIQFLLPAAICLATFSGCGGLDAFLATEKKVDMMDYYGISDGEAAVFLQDEQLEENAIVQGDLMYLSYDQVYQKLDKHFYWDGSDEILYTDAAQVITDTLVDGMNAIRQDNKLYLSTDFLAGYVDVQFTTFQNPARVVIDLPGDVIQTAAVKKNTDVRILGGYKSPILTKVRKGDSVRVLYEHNKWGKIQTSDGFIGYALLDCLNKEEFNGDTIESRIFHAEYESRKAFDRICLMWQDMANRSGNTVFEGLIKQTSGVNVISPAWLSLSDNDGTFEDLSSAEYVEKAHSMSMQVWVLIDDFNQNMSISSVLTDNEIRHNLVEKLVSSVKAVNADGINVDFEYISDNSGRAFIQFLRELYIRCRDENLILSVDNKNPTYVRYCYDMEEQGKIADYVILMGYDEHYAGSEAGSVASISYVENGIEAALEVVAADKIISGLPLYTRIWSEVPKQNANPGEEIRSDGNSEYPEYALSSSAVSMDEAYKAIQNAGAKMEWNEECGQYYSEFPFALGKKRIWLEDVKSMELKLSKVSEKELAGVAFWRLGMDNSAVWEVIGKYLANQ